MYAGTMTIDQALEAMKAGYKVKNTMLSNEHLSMVGGRLLTESGYDFTEWFNMLEKQKKILLNQGFTGYATKKSTWSLCY